MDDYYYDIYDSLEDDALTRLRDKDAQSEEDTDNEGINAFTIYSVQSSTNPENGAGTLNLVLTSQTNSLVVSRQKLDTFFSVDRSDTSAPAIKQPI